MTGGWAMPRELVGVHSKGSMHEAPESLSVAGRRPGLCQLSDWHPVTTYLQGRKIPLPPWLCLALSNPQPLPSAWRTLPVWGSCWGGGLHPFGACAQGLRSPRAIRSWCSARRACTGTGGHSPTSSARPCAAGTRTAPCPLPRQASACLPPAAPQYGSLSLS